MYVWAHSLLLQNMYRGQRIAYRYEFSILTMQAPEIKLGQQAWQQYFCLLSHFTRPSSNNFWGFLMIISFTIYKNSTIFFIYKMNRTKSQVLDSQKVYSVTKLWSAIMPTWFQLSRTIAAILKYCYFCILFLLLILKEIFFSCLSRSIQSITIKVNQQ